MQATHPPFRHAHSVSATATPLPVEDHELEDDDGPPPIVEVSEEEFDELAEPVQSGAIDLTGRVAAALAASTRAEANLRALFRTVKFLGASVNAARETNAHLLRELTQLHTALGDDSALQSDTEVAGANNLTRATLLEQALREATEQAVREREFLIAEHDSFISSLIADHEQELTRLKRRVAATATAEPTEDDSRD